MQVSRLATSRCLHQTTLIIIFIVASKWVFSIQTLKLFYSLVNRVLKMNYFYLEPQ